MTADELAEAKKELEELKARTGMKEPVRAFMDDQQYKWRFGGPPDYTLANLHYLKGKSMNHPEGSLEAVVEGLVKTWEFERSHKVDVNEHKSVNADKFLIGANGWKMFNNVDAGEAGNYNVLLAGVDKELWKPNQSWEDTHHAFKDAFAAFPWEVLKVFSGPPVVAFSWRHWAHFTGKYNGNHGKGELVNMYGFGTASVSADLKLEHVNIYYQAEDFLEVLEGKKPASMLESAKSVFGNYMAIAGVNDQMPVGGESETCPASGKKGMCPFMCG